MGKYQDFPSKIFCLTVPKNFVEEPFSVSLISGVENFYASEGYATIFDFPSNFFCLTVPKNFVGEPFSVSLISGIQKHYASEGYVTIFCRDFFCLTAPKNFVEAPFYAVFQKTPVAIKIMDKRVWGSIKIFRRKFFVSQCQKIS